MMDQGLDATSEARGGNASNDGRTSPSAVAGSAAGPIGFECIVSDLGSTHSLRVPPQTVAQSLDVERRFGALDRPVDPLRNRVLPGPTKRVGWVIEAQVRPQDIDHVKRGQTAGIRLTALSQRITPMMSGQVV